ncbi:MAG TPA: hypothetical protein ENJ18_00585 [Nannocystis exedens]|nr:hypothetical protein [Nannocystis exedens]
MILVDRLLVDGISWVDGNLEHYRTWFKASTDKPWLSITAAKKSWPGIRPRGHFRGEKGAPDAANTRYVLLSAAKMHFSVALSVLFIARDLDDQSQRRVGMQQAVDEKQWPFRVVIAWSQPESEAWYLAGFSPADEDEGGRLGELRGKLGFDPTCAPHRLSSTGRECKKDAKQALRVLSAGDPDRERACLQEAPLPKLVERSGASGLADFLNAVRDEVLPLFR